MTLNRPVYLIGFMGCGKSTLGCAASALSGLPFIDLDAVTENLAGGTAAEIFHRYGKEHFRRAEHQALHSISQTPAIVACGGGTPLRTDNMELMLRSGYVIWLTAERERIITRLMDAPAEQRPLLNDVHSDREALTARVETLMAERTPVYNQAHHKFDSTFLDTDQEITETAKRFVSLLNTLRTND